MASASVWIHEKWDPCTQEHDIAIIELLENVTFSKEVAPICLPSKDLKLAKLLRAAGAGMNLSAVINDEAIVLRLVYFILAHRRRPKTRFDHDTGEQNFSMRGIK
ncbi:hypothetical protein COOONC_11160 [Cooperia oncophora]